MTERTSSTPLPPLYARWIEELLGTEIPAQTRSTCEDCAMCKESADPRLQLERFNPTFKCCTFNPSIPNYLVGWILGEDSTLPASGRAEVRRRISRRIGATPLMLEPSTRYVVHYSRTSTDGFGTAGDLLCPYYEPGRGGRCAIWRYRPAVCSTWFCLPTRGMLGGHLWTALRELILLAESTVASWCLLELGLDRSCLDALHHRGGEPRAASKGEIQGWIDPDGKLDSALHRRLWGSWSGREEELYQSCASLAQGLGWKEIANLAGVRMAIQENRVRAAFEALGDWSIPEVLCQAITESAVFDDQRVVLKSSTAPFEPVVLQERLADRLGDFDGRPTAQVVRAAGSDGIALDDALLRTLIESGVLVRADGKDLPAGRHSFEQLTPRTRLWFFRNHAGTEVTTDIHPGEGGQPVLRIQCGAKQVEFDETELFEFGQKLVAFQNGFYAGDAMQWAAPGPTHAWERVRALLESLIAEDVLQAEDP